MSEPTTQVRVSKPERRRPRFGLRILSGMILVLALVFGGIAHMQRQASERERFVAELARDRILVNHSEPTSVGLFITWVLRTNGRDAQKRCGRWLSPGWFGAPRGFNAGRLADEKVPGVVERLKRLGVVWEVTFTQPPDTGLKLFYIDKLRGWSLGPQKSTCTFRRYPPVDPAN
jgi:hypothetical protein